MKTILEYLKKICTLTLVLLAIEVVWYFTGINFDASIKAVLIGMMVVVIIRSAIDVIILFTYEDKHEDKDTK